jgi:excisionase family DNA binding protein
MLQGEEKLTYTVPECAALLGLSRGTAYTAASHGLLPGVLRVGKRMMVSKAALQKALNEGWQPSIRDR